MKKKPRHVCRGFLYLARGGCSCFIGNGLWRVSARRGLSQVRALNPYPTIDTLPNYYVASEQVLSLLLHDSLSRFRRSAYGIKGLRRDRERYATEVEQ